MSSNILEKKIRLENGNFYNRIKIHPLWSLLFLNSSEKLGFVIYEMFQRNASRLAIFSNAKTHVVFLLRKNKFAQYLREIGHGFSCSKIMPFAGEIQEALTSLFRKSVNLAAVKHCQNIK